MDNWCFYLIMTIFAVVLLLPFLVMAADWVVGKIVKGK